MSDQDDNERRLTQIANVKRVLIRGREITPLAALQMFGSFRLAAIIHTLRKEGYPILTTRKSGTNYATYKLDSSKL